MHVITNIRCTQRLLQTHRQFFEFFVSLIEFSLDLLDLSLESYIFFLGNVVGDFKISIHVLNVLTLHFRKVLQVGHIRLFCAKYHFSPEFLSLHLLNTFIHCKLLCTELRVAHSMALYVSSWWQSIVCTLILLDTRVKALLNLVLILVHHVVVLLSAFKLVLADSLWKLSSKIASLSIELVSTLIPWISILHLSLGVCLCAGSVFNLIRLRSIFLVIVYDKDSLIISILLVLAPFVRDVHNLLLDVFCIVVFVFVDAFVFVFAFVVSTLLLIFILVHVHVVHLVALAVFVVVIGWEHVPCIFLLLVDDLFNFLVNVVLIFVVVLKII